VYVCAVLGVLITDLILINNINAGLEVYSRKSFKKVLLTSDYGLFEFCSDEATLQYLEPSEFKGAPWGGQGGQYNF